MFKEFVELICKLVQKEFKQATCLMRVYIDELEQSVFLQIVKNIGIIPENINHDSTEEKLYSKASDIVLARCFRELGLGAKALEERGDSADVIAKSLKGYQYSLVADAKCFRLSRTAKNQKDFKVGNLSDWRGDENEYAVLVAPYFQFPKNKSQIYSKALEHNVCLISWEHISLLLEHEIKETETLSLESLWNSSQMFARDKALSFHNRKDCFLPKTDKLVAKKMNIKEVDYFQELALYKSYIVERGKGEIDYWNSEIEKINLYTRKKAITELISAKKLNEKIAVITAYISKLDN
ncbi:MAG: HindIII family type II restriction endonuclease [Anaerovorax sp.]